MKDAKELLQMAYADFRSGKVAASRQAALRALEMGEESNDHDVIGDALTALCRVALREESAPQIESLTSRLDELAEASSNLTWRVYALHMRAEFARMNHHLEKADELYSQSLQLSDEIGLKGMVAAENFNRSFVSTARADFDKAARQVRAYFTITAERDGGGIMYASTQYFLNCQDGVNSTIVSGWR